MRLVSDRQTLSRAKPEALRRLGPCEHDFVIERGGWVRIGRLPGHVMRSRGHMRIERTSRGWRAWDVLRVPSIRPMRPTTYHRTLSLAKQHCESIED